jgi:hypothetical protein
MWLTDFLPTEIKGLRVMNFGVEILNEKGERGRPKILDLRRKFMEEILNARASCQVRVPRMRQIFISQTRIRVIFYSGRF